MTEAGALGAEPAGADRSRVAVVTVSYGSEDVLPAFLAGLADDIAAGVPVVVADNAASDGSPVRGIVEQAGGRASTGTQRILEIQPGTIHHRVPFVIGSTEEVALYERFLQQGHA